jgi:Flp pilus assembly pilin Flp
MVSLAHVKSSAGIAGPGLGCAWLQQSASFHPFAAAQRIQDRVKRFANDDSGKTSIEYVLIAIGIAIGIVMVVASLGSFVPHR